MSCASFWYSGGGRVAEYNAVAKQAESATVGNVSFTWGQYTPAFVRL